MKNSSAYTSKINPPRVTGIVCRDRVFAQLDACLESNVAWVSGPAGSGKTSLLASYVENRRTTCVWYKMDAEDADPATFFFCLGQALQNFFPEGSSEFPVLSSEYRYGLDAFANRFFAQIFTLPSAPRVIVIDNYHELPSDAEIHAVLSKAFANLLAGVSFIIVGREAPHPKYARLRANKVLSILKPDLLRLTLEEALLVTEALAPGFAPEVTALFHQHTLGWAAGLTLMVEHHRVTGGDAFPPVRTPQEILDYFSSEIYEQAAPLYQEFLLKTSVFDEMTVEMALALTGVDLSGQILASLNRKHFFTDVYLHGELVYLYHPLFLEFLRAKAQATFGAAGMKEIKRAAALIAHCLGLEDAAAHLFVASEDWQGLTALLEQMAVSMIEQGRTKLLIDWLEKVPTPELNRHPRLLCWLGMAELSLAHCAKARARFELSLGICDRAEDADGVYQAWSAMVDSFFLEMRDLHPLDHWIFTYNDFQRRYPGIPPGTTELKVVLSGFTAHVLRQSSAESIAPWQHRLDRLLPLTDLAVRMRAGLIKSLHHVWSGDYCRNRLLLDELREEVAGATGPAPPLPELTLKMLEATHFWLTADPVPCRAAIGAGVALASASGVSVWNRHFLLCSVQIALVEGDYGDARGLLRDLGEQLGGANSLDKFYFHLLNALIDFLQDDTASALSHLEVGHGPALTLGNLFYEGIWCLAMAQVKLKRMAYEEAPPLLERALTISQQVGSKNLQYMALLYQAQLLLELGYPDDALLSLQGGLTIGRDQNYLHFVWWVPAAVADLCALALQHRIETEYVRSLIRRRKLFPAVAPVDVASWPWEVTIHCLGKLEVLVHGELLKIQKKPLELLKAIITLGGNDVKYERIADLLWPDAEGDTGLGNFKITLHRLRQLLGENCLLYKDGKLSLNTRRVWLDVWSFERTALQASAQRCTGGDPEASVEVAQRAMSLYRGQFVREDLEQGWLFPQREKLSRSYIAIVAFLGSQYLSAGHFEKAITVYESAVEIEPLAEVLYEGLIKGYSSAGYLVNATQAYRRYESSLWEHFGVQPAKRLAQLIAPTPNL